MAIELRRGRYIVFNDCKKIVILEVRQASRYLKNNQTDKFLFQSYIFDNTSKLSNQAFLYVAKPVDVDIENIPESLNFRINRAIPDPSLTTIYNMYFDLSKHNEKNRKAFKEIYDEINKVIENPLALDCNKSYNRGICSGEELKQIFLSLDNLEKKKLNNSRK